MIRLVKKANQNKTKTFRGYTPKEWQIVVHNGITQKGKGHIHIVKAKRQIGKSWIIINELLRFAINKKGSANCCLSPTLNQSRKIYKEILKATQDTGVISKKNDSLLEIEFINGSTIAFKSAEQKENLRGYTFSGILCIDEAAYISDEVWSIIRPTTDVHQAVILIVSTPKFKMGFFYDIYVMGLSGNEKITAYDLCKYDTSEFLPKEQLELYRKMLPKNMFTTEYLGDFLDSESIVFGDFKECINREPLKDYKELYVAIDWSAGIGSDYTVVTALNERNEQVFLIYFNNKSAVQQVDYIVEYLKPYMNKIKILGAEVNGVGKPLVDSLKTSLDGKIKIEEITTTNASKISLVNQLQVAFEQRTIKLLDDEKQTNELSMYECRVNSKGTVTFNAPLGANDDCCMCLMMALDCKNKKNKKGVYHLSLL